MYKYCYRFKQFIMHMPSYKNNNNKIILCKNKIKIFSLNKSKWSVLREQFSRDILGRGIEVAYRRCITSMILIL